MTVVRKAFLVRLPPEWFPRIDAARGIMSRNAWMTALIGVELDAVDADRAVPLDELAAATHDFAVPEVGTLTSGSPATAGISEEREGASGPDGDVADAGAASAPVPASTPSNSCDVSPERREKPSDQEDPGLVDAEDSSAITALGELNEGSDTEDGAGTPQSSMSSSLFFDDNIDWEARLAGPEDDV